MNDNKNTGGRPRNEPSETIHTRHHDGTADFCYIEGGTPESAREHEKGILRIDPKRNLLHAGMIAPVILGKADPPTKEWVGKLFCESLESLSADSMESFFASLVSMKRNAECEERHRNFYAYAAYSDFIAERGHEPSKQRLKRFMREQPGKYPDQPTANDCKGWTRVWAESGLSTLEPPTIADGVHGEVDSLDLEG